MKDTLLIVMGDHVRHNRDDVMSDKSIDYETRIPLVIWEPYRKLTKGEDNRLSSQVDIWPTIVDYLDYESDYIHIGSSLLRPEKRNVLVITRDYDRKIIVHSGCCGVDLYYDGTKKLYSIYDDGNYRKRDDSEEENIQWIDRLQEFIESYNRLMANNMHKNAMINAGMSKQ